MTNLFGYDPYAEEPFQSDFSIFNEPEEEKIAPSLFGGTTDPTSRPNSFTDLFQYQDFNNPYDPTGMLKGMIDDSSKNIDGLTAERDRLRGGQDALDNSSEMDWGQVGAGLLGGAAAFLGSGKITDAAAGFSSMGTSYYNNLEAQEKDKKARLALQLKELDDQIKDQTNFGQALTTAQLNQESQDSSAFRKGEFVGTDPYNAEQQHELDKSLAIAGAKRSAGGTPISQSQTAWFVKNFPEEPIPETKEELDQRLRKAGQSDLNERQQKSFEKGRAEREIPGLEKLKADIPESSYIKAEKMKGAYDLSKTSIGGMKDLLVQNKGIPVTGSEATEFEAYSATLYRAIRNFSETGANLTFTEVPLIEALNVPTLGRNGAYEVMKKFALQGDFLEQLKAVEKVLDKTIPATFNSYGYKMPEIGETPGFINHGGKKLKIIREIPKGK